MANSKALLLVPLLFLFGGGKKKKAGAGAVDPNIGDVPAVGGLQPGTGLGEIPAFPGAIQDPFGPGLGDVPAVGGLQTPAVVWGQMVRSIPTPGFGYQVKQGDVMLGTNGLVAAALKQVQPGTPSASARQAYYEATSRVRANWMLYSTQDEGSQRVSVTDTLGNTVRGNILAAFLPMNDRWSSAMAAGVMPNRLVSFTKGGPNQTTTLPIAGWQDLLHGASRTYGCIWFPPLNCIGLGSIALTNPACDWRAALWTAVGRAQATFNGT